MPDPTQKIEDIPVSLLDINDLTRLTRNQDHIDGLVSDFHQRLARGEPPVHTPLRVMQFEGRYQIIAGGNRCLAARIAGLQTVPCIVESALARKALFLAQFGDNHKHKGYAKEELANAILFVMAEDGCSQNKACAQLGIDKGEGSRAMSVMNKFPRERQSLIGPGDGKCPFSSAALIAQVYPDVPKQLELIDRVVRGVLVRDDLAEEVAALLGGKKPKVRPVVVTHDGADTSLPPGWTWQKLAALARFLSDLAAKGEKLGVPFEMAPKLKVN